jgi:aryl carrier-like protein
VAADNYTAALADRLGDFVDPAVQWQRSLWSVGVLLALRELNEASEGVQAGALSSKAVKWLAESIRKRLPGEPGVGCEQQRKALDQLLARDLTAGGVNHRELGFWITDVETHYLARWANAVSLECRPSRELAARALASHLVDSGLSSRRLRSWLRGLLDCDTALDAPALVDAAAALLAQGLDTYKVMVLFERPPRKPTAPPEEWRDASCRARASPVTSCSSRPTPALRAK